MKLFFTTLTTLFLFCANAMADGTKSKLPLADPYVLLDGDTYYAYGTHAANGIEVWTSDDLYVWEKKGLALDKANTTEDRWFWAPEVYHKNGKYYMYYSANEHLYVATSDSPLGPFTQEGTYQMNDVLGDEKCIDSHVFFDDDDKAYLFFVRFTDGNCIWMCELEDDYMTPKASTLKKCINVTLSWENLLGRVCEGPFMVKRGNKYFLTYSANDYNSQDYAVGCATATSLSEPQWQKYLNPVLRRVEDLVGTGHHTIFTDKEGKLRIAFHAHNSQTAVHDRLTYIGTMQFTGKGNRQTLKMTNDPIIRPITKDDVTADIENIGTDFSEKEEYYTISGQRVNNPGKGLFIVSRNGEKKKVLRR
ncbi:MAG: glycoside hydrolase family 43 protein [Prevotella sp.]